MAKSSGLLLFEHEIHSQNQESKGNEMICAKGFLFENQQGESGKNQ